MKTLRLIGCVGLISLVLATCNYSVRTPSIPAQKDGENTKVAQMPAVVKLEENSKTSTPEKPSQRVTVANLADGYHRLCTQPYGSKTPSGDDRYGWCFLFRKTSDRVTGIYTYWAPSDYARICLSGTVKDNTVSGSGYEIVEGGAKPITPEDIKRLTRGGVWDNWNQEGNNLRINSPRLHSTGKYPSGEYYAWKRYGNVRLNLNRFHQRNLEKLIPPENCPNYDFSS